MENDFPFKKLDERGKNRQRGGEEEEKKGRGSAPQDTKNG
jgi:hypothetical protein